MRLATVAAVVAIALLPVLAGTAHAQPEPDAAPVPMTPLEPAQKSPALAFALSAGSTALGVGLFALGVEVGPPSGGHDHGQDLLELGGATLIAAGPSLGHWYAGRGASTGLILRAVGASVTLIGAFVVVAECNDADTIRRSDPCYALINLGTGMFVAGAVWDIATAPGAASEWNRNHQLHVTPAALPAPGGAAPGLVLSGTF